ncbi:endonuclease/exonuclease/phosphatase family protein [Streptomyces sp. NPDC018347]|uniref:endonuclease/exonuclease/phosphatase family protein n=1 Tax=Streptomyces sp. NPDC018347 TaxID=3157193 RepID=UPI0033E11952
MSTQDRIRLMLWNLERDGGPEPRPGVLPTRWRQGYEEILKPQQPDWLATLELRYSQTRPDAPRAEKRAADRRFKAAQRALGMRGFRAAVGQRSNPTGVFIRESVFPAFRQRHHPVGHSAPPTHVELWLPEAPAVPILTASFHTAYCNPAQRRSEALDLTELVDKVKAHNTDPASGRAACWLFGDTNEYPVPVGEQVPPIDWSSPEVTDIVHRRHRAIKQHDGTWVSCTAVDEIMLDCGMHDPARWAAHRLGQTSALAATAGHSADGQGGPRRIDRGYLDGWSVQAVEDVRVLDTTGLSDHHTILVDLSRRKLVECLQRRTSAIAPWSLVV